MMARNSSHRWSGWPGALCLDCGVEDSNEACLAGNHRDLRYQKQLHGEERRLLGDHVCQNDPCLEPGSNRYNPYVKET